MFKPYLSCCVNGRKIEGMYYGFIYYYYVGPD